MADAEQPSSARTMDDDAVQLHELYTSLCRGGFTQREALYLTGLVLVRRLPESLLAKVVDDDADLHTALRTFLDDRSGDPGAGRG